MEGLKKGRTFTSYHLFFWYIFRLRGFLLLFATKNLVNMDTIELIWGDLSKVSMSWLQYRLHNFILSVLHSFCHILVLHKYWFILSTYVSMQKKKNTYISLLLKEQKHIGNICVTIVRSSSLFCPKESDQSSFASLLRSSSFCAKPCPRSLQVDSWENYHLVSKNSFYHFKLPFIQVPSVLLHS